MTLLSMSSCSSVDRALARCSEEVMGSIPVGDSEFFHVPHLCHVDQLTFHIPLPSLKSTIFKFTHHDCKFLCQP